MAKPYQAIPIQDCGEPLQPIPASVFDLLQPHPYVALGAPYGDSSPFYLRQGVLAALTAVQQQLSQERPGWRLRIFDAYRPVAVQQFMVDHTLADLARQGGLTLETLEAHQRSQLLEQVYQFWAAPSPNPAMPPPHSTGAAVDVTLTTSEGKPVDMGSDIDEVSPRSHPDHYGHSSDPQEQQWHCDRSYLHRLMAAAGFRRHPNEWWHFSLGDQYWVWLGQQAGGPAGSAQYGRLDLTSGR